MLDFCDNPKSHEPALFRVQPNNKWQTESVWKVIDDSRKQFDECQRTK
jgi:hypothetical protein